MITSVEIRAALRCGVAGCPCRGKRANVHCPAHDDEHPSLSIDEGAKGFPVVHCHAGCHQTEVIAILRERGLWPVYDREERKARKMEPIKIIHYPYVDADSKFLYEVVRKDFANGTKSIYCRRPISNDKWAYDFDGIDKVLYNLPAVLRAQTVHYVEGEKCADALNRLGVYATTHQGGAEGWLEKYAVTLAGKNVVVHEDNDISGRRLSIRICSALMEHAASIRLLTYRMFAEKFDVYDWLAEFRLANRAYDGLMQRVCAAPDLRTKIVTVSVRKLLQMWSDATILQ
jgi:hypothetical protein